MTCVERFSLPLYIVTRIPVMTSDGLYSCLTLRIVYISCVSPSRAKYSHCIGISTPSALLSALTVRSPSDGGQSIIITS